MEAEVSIAKVFLSLLTVLGLIGLCALALKWLADKSIIMRQMGSGKRLKLSEVMVIDAKHKCFIFNCDEKEYVVMSNGNNIEVLESREKKEQATHEA